MLPNPKLELPQHTCLSFLRQSQVAIRQLIEDEFWFLYLLTINGTPFMAHSLLSCCLNSIILT